MKKAAATRAKTPLANTFWGKPLSEQIKSVALSRRWHMWFVHCYIIPAFWWASARVYVSRTRIPKDDYWMQSTRWGAYKRLHQETMALAPLLEGSFIEAGNVLLLFHLLLQVRDVFLAVDSDIDVTWRAMSKTKKVAACVYFGLHLFFFFGVMCVAAREPPCVLNWVLAFTQLIGLPPF